MKKKLAAIAFAGMMAVGLTAGNVQAAEPSGEVYVFIAASLANAMEDIQKDFNQKYPDVEIFYNADSSGTLQTQIEEGSRCDIFFSAATKQMDALVEEKLAKEESVVNLLENKVVLIKTKDTETRVTGFENITEAENLALAGEDVPVGQYAREIFTNLDIMDQVEAMEINEGKNVTEVLAAVTQGSNEVGDEEALPEEKVAAETFFEYLQTENALKVFEEHGFSPYTAEVEENDTEEAEDTQADQKTDSEAEETGEASTEQEKTAE